MSGPYKSVGVTVNLKVDLRGVVDAVKEAAKRGMVKWVSTEVVPLAKELSPIKFRENRNSITSEVGDPTGQEAGIVASLHTESGYGGWLEIGTGIYGPLKSPIVPIKAKVLSWLEIPGDEDSRVFAKSVRGRPATPYLYPAVENSRPHIQRFIKEEVEKLQFNTGGAQ